MAAGHQESTDIRKLQETAETAKEEIKEEGKKEGIEAETMKQREAEPDEDHWPVQHPNLGSILVTPQSWMSLSTRRDWQAEKWRQLHCKDSEPMELAKHSNATMDHQLQSATRLLEKQRRTMERQHTSLQRKLLTDNLRQKIKRENSPHRSPALRRRKSQSHEKLYSSQYQEGVICDTRPSRDKPRSVTADCHGRGSPSSPLRQRANTVDNMYLKSQQTKSKTTEHLPDITKNNTCMSKWSSMTDIRDISVKDKWFHDLINNLPPDLYAHSHTPQRMRKEQRLKRMLSRSHEQCRSVGLEDSRFVNLTAVLVKQ